MPTYEYRCKNGHQFEVVQSMADDPIAVCEVCGAPVERVFHPVAVHFKGSGFYTTDYARKSGAKASESESKDGKPAKDAGGDSKAEKKKAEPASSSAKDD